MEKKEGGDNQTETAADFPAKKLTRQLDFGGGRAAMPSQQVAMMPGQQTETGGTVMPRQQTETVRPMMPHQQTETRGTVMPGHQTETGGTVMPGKQSETVRPMMPRHQTETRGAVMPGQQSETVRPMMPRQQTETGGTVMSGQQSETGGTVMSGQQSETVRPMMLRHQTEMVRTVMPGQQAETVRAVRPVMLGLQATVRAVMPCQQTETVRPVMPGQQAETDRPVMPGQQSETVRPMMPRQQTETVRTVMPGQQAETVRPVMVGLQATVRAVISCQHTETVRLVMPGQQATVRAVMPCQQAEAVMPVMPSQQSETVRPVMPGLQSETVRPMMPCQQTEMVRTVMPGQQAETVRAVRPVMLGLQATIRAVMPCQQTKTVRPVMPGQHAEMVRPVMPGQQATVRAVMPCQQAEAVMPSQQAETVRPVMPGQQSETVRPMMPGQQTETVKTVMPGQQAETVRAVRPVMLGLQATVRAVMPCQQTETVRPVMPGQQAETDRPVMPGQQATVRAVMPSQQTETVRPAMPGQQVTVMPGQQAEVRPMMPSQQTVVRVPVPGQRAIGAPMMPGQQAEGRVVLMPMQAQSPLSSVRPIKPESPKPRPRTNAEPKDSTPKKQKQCNCKHSKCLKLYCECFASAIYCDGCNCLNCYNNVENESARREAVEATLERNPNAFRPKIACSPHGARDVREKVGEVLVLGKHNKGCHCKKSGCLKKYCECFQANILCSDNCKCMDCKNYEGTEERQALFYGDTHNIAYLQQAANAAITGAIGSSGFGSPPISKKRKGQEILFGSNPKDLSFHRLSQYQPANNMKSSIQASPVSSIPVTHANNNSMLGSSKLPYRSLLADIIQQQDLQELCAVLTVFSAEAAKTLAEQKSAVERQGEGHDGVSFASSAQDQLKIQNESEADKSVPDDRLSGTQAEKIIPDESNSDKADVSKARPMSPGTLALMCDEQDTMFMAATSSPKRLGHGSNTSSQLPHGHGLSEIQAEQERVVLTKFRDCLNRLITLGDIRKEKQYSMTRGEPAGVNVLASNGSASNRTELRNQHEHVSNGITKPSVPTTSGISIDLGTIQYFKWQPVLENSAPC